MGRTGPVNIHPEMKTMSIRQLIYSVGLCLSVALTSCKNPKAKPLPAYRAPGRHPHQPGDRLFLRTRHHPSAVHHLQPNPISLHLYARRLYHRALSSRQVATVRQRFRLHPYGKRDSPTYDYQGTDYTILTMRTPHNWPIPHHKYLLPKRPPYRQHPHNSHVRLLLGLLSPSCEEFPQHDLCPIAIGGVR